MDDGALARPRLNLLTPAHVEAVHEGSLRILRELGLRVDSERARRVFGKAGRGVRIEGDRVTFERDVVEWAIRVSPATVDVFDRRGASTGAPGCCTSSRRQPEADSPTLRTRPPARAA